MEKSKNLYIYMTHGHELRGQKCWWEGWCRAEGNKGEKKWDNCNSIINKMFFLKNIERSKDQKT